MNPRTVTRLGLQINSGHGNAKRDGGNAPGDNERNVHDGLLKTTIKVGELPELPRRASLPKAEITELIVGSIVVEW
jgi:hypothetical protein